LPKLFDLQLAQKLGAQDQGLTLDQSAAALNRAHFFTFTGRRWTAGSLRIARPHLWSPAAVSGSSAGQPRCTT